MKVRVALVAAALVSVTAPAAHAAQWMIRPSPNPSETADAYLHGVSCVSTYRCIAVGESRTADGDTVPLAQQWDGGSWDITATPVPNGSTTGRLLGVSCVDAICLAVGYYVPSSGSRTALALRWDGTSWAVAPAAAPAGSTKTRFNGVSCASATRCIAVGEYTSSTGLVRPLAEQWSSGSGWAVQTIEAPAATSDSRLIGVSCPTATTCVAAGYRTSTAGDIVGMAEHWSGSTWTQRAVPAASGALATWVYALSCVTATVCEAVGATVNSANALIPYAARWNGTAWKSQTVSLPPGPDGGILTGVTCLASTQCIASGLMTDPTEGNLALVERLSGSAWAAQLSVHQPDAQDESLDAVSCTASKACQAVGGYRDASNVTHTLVAEFNPVWTVQPVPEPQGDSLQLDSVSCPAPDSCVAVGGTIFADDVISERWTGSSWTSLATPSPAGATTPVLESVSCTGSAACTAVGKYDGGNATHALVERLTLLGWSLQSLPAVPNASAVWLNGVSCTSASACTAVGTVIRTDQTWRALAFRWDGTSWVQQAARTPAGAVRTQLKAVSCSGASSCVAVGTTTSNNLDMPVAERWDGTSWRLLKAAGPGAGTEFATLDAVSCWSATRCMAVGGYVDSTRSQPLAERLHGATWTRSPVAEPVDSRGAQLLSVSCPAANTCTAGGHFGKPAGGFNDGSLIDRWTGSEWVVQPSPDGLNAAQTYVYGISCAARDACQAVGWYTTGVYAAEYE